MKDVSSIVYPDGGTSRVDATQTGTTINIKSTNIPESFWNTSTWSKYKVCR